MKPKKKVRNSGYYWVRFQNHPYYEIARYRDDFEQWTRCGTSIRYFDTDVIKVLSKRSLKIPEQKPTPITIPKPRKK